MKDRIALFKDLEWISSAAVRPFMGTEDEPAPSLPEPPINELPDIESAVERFHRMADEFQPVGSTTVDGKRVYSMDGVGSGTWLFMRDPSEFTSTR